MWTAGVTSGCAGRRALPPARHRWPASRWSPGPFLPRCEGRAFAAVSGAELAGIAIGPILGSTVGIDHMATLFVVSAAAAALACVPVLASRAARVDVSPITDRKAAGLPRAGVAGAALRGVLLVAVISGLLSGVYEACWSLLMHARGATDTQIGLSWTLFAVPFVLVAPLAGRLADTTDRRFLVLGALASSVVFIALYPFLPNVAWLLGLGIVESLGFVFAVPAAQSMLSEHVPAESVGAAQGLFVALQTAAIAASAATAGGLFGISLWLPFVGGAAATALLLLFLPVLWRDVPGRAAQGQVAISTNSVPQTSMPSPP